MQSQYFDTVVIGSGVAGLAFLHYYAGATAHQEKKKSVALFCKSSFANTNTNWAQGGIAAVAPQPSAHADSIDSHINDTLIAGAFANNPFIVKKVIEEGPQLMKDLMDWGMPFDRNQDNQIDLAKEGGHLAHRVWHVKDYTGKALQETLIKNVSQHDSIFLFEHHLVYAIHKIEASLFLVQVYDVKVHEIKSYYTSVVVLASGGLGQLYQETTNATVATADGIYLAHCLGAKIQDLSFIQFHPTGLYANASPTFLISEALRGAGAVLRNWAGIDFMHKYHPSGSLAPRDIVSRAIITEMEIEMVPHQFLDATMIDKNTIESHFPNIYQTVQKVLGIDLTKTYIPIVPTQHYSCGGIAVNEFGESTVPNVYAIGECASTGLHGANRLASNSLLEGLAFAKFAAQDIVDKTPHVLGQNVDVVFQNYLTGKKEDLFLSVNIAQIKSFVSLYANVKKSTDGLQKGLDGICKLIQDATQSKTFTVIDFESTCMAQVALLLFKDALKQQKNIGVFYNESIL